MKGDNRRQEIESSPDYIDLIKISCLMKNGLLRSLNIIYGYFFVNAGFGRIFTTKNSKSKNSPLSKLTGHILYSDSIICIRSQYLLQHVKGEIIMKFQLLSASVMLTGFL